MCTLPYRIWHYICHAQWIYIHVQPRICHDFNCIGTFKTHCITDPVKCRVHTCLEEHQISKQLWSADKPHSLWKFGETALWMLALLPGSCRMWTCLHGKSLASFSHWTRLQYLKCSDVIELCNGTVFNLYLRLPHTQAHNSNRTYTAWSGSNIAFNKHFSGISDTTGTRDGITIPQLSISPILTLAVSILVLTVSIWYLAHVTKMAHLAATGRRQWHEWG